VHNEEKMRGPSVLEHDRQEQAILGALKRFIEKQVRSRNDGFIYNSFPG